MEIKQLHQRLQMRVLSSGGGDLSRRRGHACAIRWATRYAPSQPT